MSDSMKFPKWFTILTWALVISNLFVFGIFSIIHPDLPFPDMGKTEAAFPIQFFAIRHVAFGVVLLHAIIKKRVEVLKALYHLFLIIAILDVALIAIHGYYVPVLVKFLGEFSLPVTLLISSSLFILPMFLTVRYLRNIGNT